MIGTLEKSVAIILATNFWASFSIFMALPFFTIYLVQETALSLTDAAIILGVTVWLQQAGVLLGGMATDRFGLYSAMIIGLLLRLPAYCILALADSFWLLLLAGSLLGSGGALYLPAAKTALIEMSDGKARAAVLSARNICNNAGVAIGPLVGSLVFAISPTTLFLFIAAVFLILTLINLNLKIAPKAQLSEFKFSQVYNLINQSSVVVLCISMAFFFAFYIQLEVLAPVAAFELFGEIGPSAIFVVNAVVVIVAQPPLVSRISNSSRTLIFPIGFIIIAFAFVILGFAEWQPLLLFLAIAVLSLAEVLLTLRLDLEISAISERYIGTCFGLLGLSAGIGGFIGSSLGAVVYEHFKSSGASFTSWNIFALTAFVATLILAVLWKLVKAKPLNLAEGRQSS